ncbi:MAG: hypothetical protein HYZ28_10215 [Myxococcales bacterium]|nr:hypothetical protein [Myxococcales bacterium]
MSFEELIKAILGNIHIVLGLLGLVVGVMQSLKKKSPELPSGQPRLGPQRRARQKVAAAPKKAAPTLPRADPFAEVRRKLVAAVEEMEKAATALAEEVQHERANRRFHELLGEWIPKRAQLIRSELVKAKGRPDSALVQAVNALSLVLEEARELVSQRRDKKLLPLLGDADALADACYSPILTHAQAEGLPLSSAHPAAQLAPVDLAIWTGFAPTSVAPIFLPPSFFERVVYWPAVAHEIGHDFLISVRGLEKQLREELSLSSEDMGTRPLRFVGGQLDILELQRLMGAWFEETFCDVFGTLMCGPAYVETMVELFAARQDAREVLVAVVDGRTGRHDVHPPRHLRVHAGCRVLERSGHSQQARELWSRWCERHGFLGEEPIPLLFPLGGRLVSLPFEVFAELAAPILERLHTGPLKSLGGMGLSDVSGLDYGPHEHSEAGRARDALVAGRAPSQRDPRAIIAGAVLAWRKKPELEPRILELAREAIPAVGTGEHHPDSYQPSHAEAPAAGPIDVHPRAFLEAVLLGELLRRPHSSKHASRAGAAGVARPR